VLVFEVRGVGAVDHLAGLEDLIGHLKDGRVHALLVEQFEFDFLERGKAFNHAPRAFKDQVIVEHWAQLVRVADEDQFLAALQYWNQDVEILDL